MKKCLKCKSEKEVKEFESVRSKLCNECKEKKEAADTKLKETIKSEEEEQMQETLLKFKLQNAILKKIIPLVEKEEYGGRPSSESRRLAYEIANMDKEKRDEAIRKAKAELNKTVPFNPKQRKEDVEYIKAQRMGREHDVPFSMKKAGEVRRLWLKEHCTLDQIAREFERKKKFIALVIRGDIWAEKD